MDRTRLRWDYKRGFWRQIRGGKASWYWLKPCRGCGKEELFVPRGGWCFNCRKPHYKLLDDITKPAHRMVKKAIKDGVLPRLDGGISCVDCGLPARVYDHREYARPLDVQPVCYGCNVKRGPAKETADLIRVSRLSVVRYVSPGSSG